MDTKLIKLASAELASIPTHENSSTSLTTSLQRRTNYSLDKDGDLSLSIYCSDKVADNDVLATGIIHLKNAFPEKATDSVCAEIIRCAKLVGMGARQFVDSVNEYICHHRYNTITVADILDYDVRMKLYTGEQVYKLCGTYGEQKDKELYPRYGKINGRTYCVSITDVMALPTEKMERVMEKIKKFEEDGR